MPPTDVCFTEASRHGLRNSWTWVGIGGQESSPLLPSVSREQQMHSSIICFCLPLKIGVDHLPNGCLAVWKFPEGDIDLKVRLCITLHIYVHLQDGMRCTFNISGPNRDPWHIICTEQDRCDKICKERRDTAVRFNVGPAMTL